MSRSLSRRVLRRLKQADRNRIVIRARKVDTQNDDLSERKRIEKLWEESIDYFAGTTRTLNTPEPKGDNPDGNA